MLEVMNSSSARKNFREVLQTVADEDNTVVITRKNGENVAVINLRRLNRLEKAIRNLEYLQMLNESIESLEKGGIVFHSMEELEAATLSGNEKS